MVETNLEIREEPTNLFVEGCQRNNLLTKAIKGRGNTPYRPLFLEQ